MADFFFIGLLVITGLHHLVLFALRRRERAALWFAAMCLLLALRLCLLGRYLQADCPVAAPGCCSGSSHSDLLPLGAGGGALPERAVPEGHAGWLVRRYVAAISARLRRHRRLPGVGLLGRVVPLYQFVTLATIVIGVAGVIRAVVRERDAPPVLMLIGLLSARPGRLSRHPARALGRAHPLHRAVRHHRLRRLPVGAAGAAQSAPRQAAGAAQRRGRIGSTASCSQLNDELKRQIAGRSHELSQAVMMMAHQRSESQRSQPAIWSAERYRIVAPIGEGGMGTVFRAERVERRQRPVALKLIRGNADPEMLARFAREAEVVASIDHPNVVGILDFNVSRAGLFYLVMELVEGRSLEAERARFGDVGWALPLVAQLSRGARRHPRARRHPSRRQAVEPARRRRAAQAGRLRRGADPEAAPARRRRAPRRCAAARCGEEIIGAPTSSASRAPA